MIKNVKSISTSKNVKKMFAYICDSARVQAVVKLPSKRWWISTGARLEGPKLEPEGLRAEVGYPTADQGFSSIQRTLFGFYGI